MQRMKTSAYSVAFDSIDAVLAELKDYRCVLLIKTDKVEYLYAEDVTNLERLTELRAHTKDKELHLLKADGRFIGRVRTDGAGDDTEYMDEIQCLWGTAKSFDGKYAKMSDNKGRCLCLPLFVSTGKSACMTVRSYWDAEVFECVDYRIVELCAEGGEGVG